MAFWLGVWRIVHSRKMHGHCGTACKLPHTSCIRWEFKSHLHFPSSLLLMRVLGDRQWWLQYSHWCGIPMLSSELLALAGSAPVGYRHLGSEPVGERYLCLLYSLSSSHSLSLSEKIWSFSHLSLLLYSFGKIDGLALEGRILLCSKLDSWIEKNPDPLRLLSVMRFTTK